MAPRENKTATDTPEPLPPDHDIYTRLFRVGTWNVRNAYNEGPITQLAVAASFDYLAISEPLLNGGSDDRMQWIKRSAAYIRDHGFELKITPHQITICDQERIKYSSLSDPTAFFNGRIIQEQFEVEGGRTLTIISVYNVANSSTKTYADNTDRAALKMAVEIMVRSLANKAINDNPDGFTIVMGDLQEEYDGPFLSQLQELGLQSPHILAASRRRTQHNWNEPRDLPPGFHQRQPKPAPQQSIGS